MCCSCVSYPTAINSCAPVVLEERVLHLCCSVLQLCCNYVAAVLQLCGRCVSCSRINWFVNVVLEEKVMQCVAVVLQLCSCCVAVCLSVLSLTRSCLS